MNISHLIIPLVLVIFLCAACQPNSTVQSTPEFKNSTLKVGTVYGHQTYYIGPNGPTGFEYELALGFADYLGLELDMLAFLSFEELQEQLALGEIDIIAAGSGQFGGHSQRFSKRWGPTYQTVNHELVFLQGQARPRTMAELEGETAVVAGTGMAKSLLNKSQNTAYSDIALINDKDGEELLTAVAEGSVTYTVADSNTLNIARRKYPDLSIGFTVSDNLPVAWQLRGSGDDRLQALLFEYVAQIRADGSMAQLEDKYFGHVRSFDFVDTKAFIESAKTVLPEYIDTFKSASGDLDWRLLAALSYQESHWDPKAVSPTGVRGMMMLTLATAKDWDVSSRLDPFQSIAGGARYFSSLTRRIPARIENPDRIWMALAAYNIGLGHLEDARVLTQRHGGDPDIWVDVKKRLPLLQQKRYYSKTRYGYARGNEALKYVENIRRYYDTLVWLDNQGTFMAVESALSTDNTPQSTD